MINHGEVSISLFQILLIRILFCCKQYTVVIKIFINFRIHCDICYSKDKLEIKELLTQKYPKRKMNSIKFVFCNLKIVSQIRRKVLFCDRYHDA